MKISIITVSLNSNETIGDTIRSVLSQDYDSIEYIVVDGSSTDGTVDSVKTIIKEYPQRDAKIISEKDGGIYDAMNKGISMSTGEIVGILNSDDFYTNKNIVSHVVNEFVVKNVGVVFGDLIYVHPRNLEKVTRYYGSENFSPKKMAYGWMPSHPSFFVRKEMYEIHGLYKCDYKVAADYEFIARLLSKNKVSYSYLPKVFVKMRTGGVSTKNLRSIWIMNKEILRACAENDIRTNLFKILSKYPAKILQLTRRK